jgi:NAD+ synthase (glutamine-hydrolysing)
VTVSHVANPTANAAEVLEAARLCHERSVAIAVFPELCLSGYAIEDLLMQQSLLEAAAQALESVVEASANWMTALVVGCPLRHGARIYNCATIRSPLAPSVSSARFF